MRLSKKAPWKEKIWRQVIPVVSRDYEGKSSFSDGLRGELLGRVETFFEILDRRWVKRCDLNKYFDVSKISIINEAFRIYHTNKLNHNKNE